MKKEQLKTREQEIDKAIKTQNNNIVIDDIGQMYDPTNIEEIQYVWVSSKEKKPLENLINELELKIKNQGIITNARDEDNLYKLKKMRNK